MRLILAVLIFPARLWLRFWRAVRFKCVLHYSWRLAWCVAGRSA